MSTKAKTKIALERKSTTSVAKETRGSKKELRIPTEGTGACSVAKETSDSKKKLRIPTEGTGASSAANAKVNVPSRSNFKAAAERERTGNFPARRKSQAPAERERTGNFPGRRNSQSENVRKSREDCCFSKVQAVGSGTNFYGLSVEQRLRAKIDELERRQKADQEEHHAKIDKNMEQYKKEQQQKMEEDQQKQQQKMEEYKEEPQQKMEEYKKEQQQKMEQYKKEQQQKMEQYQEEHQHKMEQYQKEQQQAIDVLTEKQKVSCSVLAERPIPKGNVGIFYYEVKILRIKCYIYVGLAPKQMPLNKTVGEFKGSYAYSGSRGHFFGHVVEGCSQIVGRPYIEGIPSFGVSDVIGCGVDLATRQIIYTKNGQRLKTAGLFVDFAAELFPCVTLLRNGDKIEANFGPNFEYKF
ncbi:hypothetical protein GPALN_012058 [Globodera pallida]|nr:hypothetical protein GPALN_012058 [Globodera pallida]